MAVIPVKREDLPKSSVIPEGTYRVRVKTAKFRSGDEVREKFPDFEGADAVEASFVVQDEGEFFGRHVFDNLDLDGQFAWRLGKFLDAIEYPADENVDTDRLVDAELYIVVGIRPAGVSKKNGKEYDERNGIKKFVSLNQSPVGMPG